MINKTIKKIPVQFEHNIYTKVKGEPKRVYLLLHGYLLDGDYILNTLEDCIPNDSLIISPDAPFVVPVKKRDFHIPKYAWYFFDSGMNKYYIDFFPACEYLREILNDFNKDHLPVTLIGYSQGGYLSAKVAELFSDVDEVYGLACSFKSELCSPGKGVTYTQLHGACDIIVDPVSAKEEFEKLPEQSKKGGFHLLAESAHRIDSDFKSTLKKLLN